MPHQLSDYTYTLPDELIAHTPLADRSSSRIMIIDRTNKQITHTTFDHLPTYLDSSWVLVRNNSKVLPARIYAHKTTGGAVEILLSKKISGTDQSSTWECLTRPGVKPGQTIIFENSKYHGIVQENEGSDYTKTITFNCPDTSFYSFLDAVGSTPLPPYIHASPEEEKIWQERYQTIYAKQPGSVAAPTAGLHMTSTVETELKNKGIDIIDVTLHVGLGTFLPVKTKDISAHTMHSESFSLDSSAAQALSSAVAQKKKIVSLGTTTTRVLETLARQQTSDFSSVSGETDIYIYPPYQFKLVQGLITNFHLPESTLLMLVSAFCSYPQTADHFSTFSDSLIGQAYQQAVEMKYRFFSFGDCMLII